MSRIVYCFTASFLIACAPQLRDDQFLCPDDRCPDDFTCCSGMCRRACADTDAGNADTGVRMDASDMDADGMDAGVDTREDASNLDATSLVDAIGTDAGGGTDAGEVDVDAGCPGVVGGIVIFITSETFDGNLGGLTTADRLCDTAAGIARLPSGRRTRAYLSTSSSAVIHHINGWAGPGPVYDLCGTRLADSLTALLTGPEAPLTLDEYRAHVAVGTPVWTGTSRMGLHDVSCLDWSDATGSFDDGGMLLGTIGQVGQIDGRWIGGISLLCSEQARLYCVSRP